MCWLLFAGIFRENIAKMTIEEAKKKIINLYGGKGWPSIFTNIRVSITAPFDALEPHIPQKGFIVDLGCGYGIFANLLGLLSPDRKILGLELNNYKLANAYKGVKNVEFRLSDITKIDIPPADCILLIHVLHHLDSYEQQEPLIRACLDKLKTGGKLIIAEVDRRPWWKFILANIADRILYRFNKPLYIFPKRMFKILGKLSLEVAVYRNHHKNTPFSHITYVCTKT